MKAQLEHELERAVTRVLEPEGEPAKSRRRSHSTG